MNGGADRNSDTIEDLEYLNFHEIANQLRDFNKIFFPNGVPKSPDARQVEFDKFPEEKLNAYIIEMDSKFWESSDDLENKILEHINKTGIGEV